MVYSSAAAKNLKPILENNDLSVLSDRPLVFFDQVFCFIRKLNIGNISPKIGEKDIEGIKDFLNGFLEEKHKEIIHALCSDSSSALSSQGGKPEASCHGLNTPASHELQTNFYRVCELINTIAVIQSLFMMKGSKNLDTIVGFVCAVRSLGPNEDSNNYQCNIQSILLDDEIALKLPKNQQLDGFQVTTFDEQSQKSFDVKKDDMDLNEIFNEIDERILAFFLAFSDPSHLVENFTFPEVELEEFEDSSLDDDVFYDKDYQDQIGGNLEITELPSEIKENIDFILPNLSESTQNVIHFLNLRLKNAKGRGSQSNAYEALSNRWLQYALFTKDQTKKSRASQIAEWYKERAEALD